MFSKKRLIIYKDTYYIEIIFFNLSKIEVYKEKPYKFF
jgi:hypothetical protein